jgi:hypothetical protein
MPERLFGLPDLPVPRIANAEGCPAVRALRVDFNELEKIASEWKSIDFDTILAGFEPADIEGLLNPGGDDDDEDDDDRHDKELDKSDVTVAVGLYRFRITQEEFIAWCDRVKQDAGFDKESVLNEIRSRLGL